MRLELSSSEVDTLRALLHDVLPALQFKVARTLRREIRHMLAERQELVERLLARVSEADPEEPAPR